MRIVILGAGICGLGTARLLAQDGHDITLLERDPDPVPDSPQEAWDHWTRKGVAQFRQPHNFMPGLRLALATELPDVEAAAWNSGMSKYDLLHPLPPSFTDREPRDGDDRFWTYTARRPVAEWVFADAVQRDRRITVRRGVRVAGFVTGAAAIDGVPHVTGVRTVDGDTVSADLVVDCTGRQSAARQWLGEAGARPFLEEQADSGFAYYTRYFTGKQPERRGATLMPIGTITLLTLQGDNGTWSVTVFTAAGDQPLKTLRHADVWTHVVRACPLQAHWLEGEPITDVLVMSGIVDRYRRFVVDGRPVVTGFVAVADAWACTNPSAGRGLTVGFKHALQLRDALRETSGDPQALADRFDQRTEHEITPWYRAQIAVDRARFAQMEALRADRAPEPAADELARGIFGLLSLMPFDADLFRAALEYIATITPAQQVLRRPDVQARMQALRSALQDVPLPQTPGPNRRQLLALTGQAT